MKNDIGQWFKQSMPLLILLIVGISITITSRLVEAIVLVSQLEITLSKEVVALISILGESIENFGFFLTLLTIILLALSWLFLEKSEIKKEIEDLKSQKNEA